MKFNGIQTDRLESFGRRLLGIRNGGIVPTLSPEAAIEIGLPPTLDTYALSDAWPFGASGFFSAVAGEFPCVVITNNSPNLLLCFELNMSGSITQVYSYVRGTRTLDGAGPISVLDQSAADYRDTRRPRGNFPTGISSGAITFQASTCLASTTVGLNRFARKRSINGAEVKMPEIVLAPGEAVSCISDTANATLYYEVIGTVRPANQDELATS